MRLISGNTAMSFGGLGQGQDAVDQRLDLTFLDRVEPGSKVLDVTNQGAALLLGSVSLISFVTNTRSAATSRDIRRIDAVSDRRSHEVTWHAKNCDSQRLSSSDWAH